MSGEREKEGLKMVWPEDMLNSPPAVHLPLGYTMRTFRPGDEAGFYELMDLAGFGHWNDEVMQPWRDMVLPDGWFLIVDGTGRQMVATAIAHHRPDALHPFGGSLGWLAGHPDHAGKGFGHGCKCCRCVPIARGRLQEYLPQHRRLAFSRAQHLP
jgi:mycothiol synthase